MAFCSFCSFELAWNVGKVQSKSNFALKNRPFHKLSNKVSVLDSLSYLVIVLPFSIKNMRELSIKYEMFYVYLSLTTES